MILKLWSEISICPNLILINNNKILTPTARPARPRLFSGPGAAYLSIWPCRPCTRRLDLFDSKLICLLKVNDMGQYNIRRSPLSKNQIQYMNNVYSFLKLLNKFSFEIFEI
ncbi:hypothetical protein BpHYR1_013122 [Brachionus plicatilis]|uniref:Uncharacterized protein n=1 Tax=Brachionus plicatilis TaxID=10195 RepID=A0A3M7Q8R7_BRAPC|nr:hypothetical protein BpHYR1_013122 [Brachionus plicatilis]